MIIKIFILVALYKILVQTNSPLACAGLYSFVAAIFHYTYHGFLIGSVAVVISFALAYLYFWLLSRFDQGILFWVILLGGALIGLV